MTVFQLIKPFRFYGETNPIHPMAFVTTGLCFFLPSLTHFRRFVIFANNREFGQLYLLGDIGKGAILI